MTLSELIERVERLDGPDRETDFAIYQALRPELAEWQDTAKTSADDYWFWMSQREYTASLDAAIALTERALPGAFIDIRTRACGEFHHAEIEDDETGVEASSQNAPSPAIALILATLRALSAQERDDGR